MSFNYTLIFSFGGFFSRKERNMLEAASAGASASIKLVANIAVNLIAFIALLAFVNAALSWLGSLVDYPEFNFLVRTSSFGSTEKNVLKIFNTVPCFKKKI